MTLPLTRLLVSLGCLTLLGCSDRGAAVVTDPPAPPRDPPAQPPASIRLDSVAGGLSSPVYLTAPAGDARLFVVEQSGRIRVVQNGQLLSTPFLDITSKVLSGGERGLLSVAFHPRYAANGLFYVYYTDRQGDIVIERYRASASANVADAGSGAVVLSIPHRLAANHNGGLALFGPDGMLYVGTGDGGGRGDPQGNGQHRGTPLLGDLLRIDVDRGDPYAIPPTNPFAGQQDARGEVWAYGLRNPWRFAFDRQANLLYLADVGQDSREEVNVAPAGTGGQNYGWNIMEGLQCFRDSSCSREGLTLPVLEYSSTEGCSIIGGFVYRGTRIPGLAGTYFYADYCRGWIRSFRYANGQATEQREWNVRNVGSILSFGEDAAGELYVLSANGRVYRMTAG